MHFSRAGIQMEGEKGSSVLQREISNTVLEFVVLLQNSKQSLEGVLEYSFYLLSNALLNDIFTTMMKNIFISVSRKF